MKKALIMVVGSLLHRQYCAMSAKGRRKFNWRYDSVDISIYDKKANVVILMAVARKKIIKGKLVTNGQIADFIERSLAFENALTLNVLGFFTPVWIGLLALHTKNAELADAQADVLLKVAGAVATRNGLLIEVEILLQGGVDYINQLARVNQTQAIAIIQAATMTVIDNTRPEKDFFNVKRVPNRTGFVICKAKKVKKAKSYEYQMLVGDIWVACASGTSSELVGGLKPLTIVFFRYRAICTHGVKTDWCNEVYCAVL